MATFDEFYQSLDPDDNIRGEQFEKKFAKWFLETDPTWSSQIEEVWLWDDYPKRSEWGIDCGIDIVFHHVSGERWAVQAKCFSPDNYLSKGELNSFIADASDERFQGRLLISSTNKIGPNADKLLKRHNVIRILLKDLRDAHLKYPSSIKDLYKVNQPEKYTPKPHQREAINEVTEKLNLVDKGQVIMACGTGKTLTSLWIKEKLFAKNTLVLVPSLSLLRQLLKNWNSQKCQSFKWLCVCSDNTVAKDKKNDSWITNTSELDISVTSDLYKIKEFLSQSGQKVIFSTYQSSDLICEVQKIMRNFIFDLTIADEAHNCTGRFETYFGNILDDTKIRTRKKLFFTATPKILSTRIKNKSKEKEIEVASMDNESIFGEVLYKLDFTEAIQNKILTDYQVSVVGIDNEEIRHSISNRELITTHGDYIFDAESLGTYIAIIKSIKNYKLHKLISFHNLLKNAEIFSNNLSFISNTFQKNAKDKINISSDFVKGNMNATLKDEKIQKLNAVDNNDCFILSNSRCLSEGVDVPSLDGVAFVDPKHSPIDIIQAVGRAIRKSENKKVGTIIIPVFLDDISNIDEQILTTKFKTVWNVILALKAQDDELLETIDSLRVQLGSKKITTITSKGFEKIHFDLPDNINPKFYESLYTFLVKNTSEDWYEYYGKILDNIHLHGFLDITRSNDKTLSWWISKQRSDYKEKKLSKEKITLLDSLKDKGWIWDYYSSIHLEWFNTVIEFYQNNNHLNISRKFKKENTAALMLRTNYAKGILESKFIDKLNSLKHEGWMWEPTIETSLEKIRLLKDWCYENNTIYPAKNTIHKGSKRTYNAKLDTYEFDLCNFVIKLRSRYNIMKYKNDKNYSGYFSKTTIESNTELRKSEIDEISSINGWYWDRNEGFARVYKKCIEKNIEITSTKKVDFDLYELRNIGSWITNMRTYAISGVLKMPEILLIESLPNWSYQPKHDSFMRGIKEFAEYTKDKSDKDISQKLILKNGFKLGVWTNTVRRSFKERGRLSPNDKYSNLYINLLNNYGFIWKSFRGKMAKEI